MPITALVVGLLWLPIISASTSPRWWAMAIGSAAGLFFITVRQTAAHTWGGLFLLWAAASIMWAGSGFDAGGELPKLAALALVFCVAAEAKSSDATFLALGLAASANAALMLLQAADLVTWLIPLGHAPGYPVGTFGNKNVAANFGALALLGVLLLLLRDGRRPLWLYGSAAAGSAVCAFLPFSRGAILAVLLALCLRERPRWTIPAIGVAFAGFLAAAWWRPWLNLYDSAAPRLEQWDWSLSNLKLFGWGAGNYGSVFPWEHANNDAIELAFEYGVGALLLVGFFTYVLRCRSLPAEWRIVVAYLVIGLVTFPMHEPAVAFVAAFAAGRLAGERGRLGRGERSSRAYGIPSLS